MTKPFTVEEYDAFMGLTMLVPERAQEEFLGNLLEGADPTHLISLAGFALQDASNQIFDLCDQVNAYKGLTQSLELQISIYKKELEAREALILDNQKAYMALEDELAALQAKYDASQRPPMIITGEDLRYHRQDCMFRPNSVDAGREILVEGLVGYVIGQDKDDDIWYVYQYGPENRIKRGCLDTKKPFSYTGNWLAGFDPNVPEGVKVLFHDAPESISPLLEGSVGGEIDTQDRGRIILIDAEMSDDDQPFYGIGLGWDKDNDFWFAYHYDGGLHRDFCSMRGYPHGTDEEAYGVFTPHVHPRFS